MGLFSHHHRYGLKQLYSVNINGISLVYSYKTLVAVVNHIDKTMWESTKEHSVTTKSHIKEVTQTFYIKDSTKTDNIELIATQLLFERCKEVLVSTTLL